VAHVVCSSLGFATNGASETYIAIYKGDADFLMAILEPHPKDHYRHPHHAKADLGRFFGTRPRPIAA
jgi:hypothetical protein